MSVLKNLQDLSDLEFYKCAEKLQDDITEFGGYYGKEENGINGRRARRDRIANPHSPIKARRAN